ncbi:CDGSH iron-sulfur domain-containing protein [Nitrosarchaeum sp. AC2]|uniref:CDGSH iron-sulfur domain-containing protein n=1 Tax=Nitrosarchaeum sp. AC2 TaxID=2259673 RepID=UPI0015CDF84F|nr:CDGSH iron-sulfur domain-containing protein [Nitrosarchaeum sp. AC2]MBS3922123.1 CDGSH iron-sulfur domain-containing protein [Nitrosarchaeum sp.]MCE9652437.1 CDGSH iron-sulfur domain-containing protein [Nitrosarchaeum sp.]QLH11028.1 CDGSH iron-sulfur domain-containing protein [Nitrosarchaeum sp. AC2]
MNKVTIKALENGPFIVEVDGKTVSALCRCGKSENKPYCDGTHAKIGFQANKSEIKII